jgi:hypothetical protein
VAEDSPKHPTSGQFVKDPHSTGRALVGKHVKAAQADRPRGIKAKDWHNTKVK